MRRSQQKTKPKKIKTLNPARTKTPEASADAPAHRTSNGVKKEKKAKKEEKKEKYFEETGRRKTATCRVRIFTQGKKEILVNDKPFQEYFPIFSLQKIVQDPLREISSLDKFRILTKVKGGGLAAQAEAVRLGIARTLLNINPYFKKRLRKAGFLTRDPRMRERKKPGLKRARRAPQWSKR